MTDAQRRWQVLIEENIGAGQGARWRPRLFDALYADPERAREAALTAARSHVPKHPFTAGARTVLRHDENTYTVVVEGISQQYHFRVSVVEKIG